MLSCAELQTKLDGYLAARDAQLTGGAITGMTFGAKSISYKPDPRALQAAIDDVRAEMCRRGCGDCSGVRRMAYITPVDC